MFTFYRLSCKLKTEQLGTCTEVSIHSEHVLQKAKKAIKQANKLSAKVTKELEKYVGTKDIPKSKETAELMGIIRHYHQLLGKKDEIPTKSEPLLEYAKELEEEFETLVSQGEQQKATVFMKTAEGKPMISSHMIIGNLKANLAIVVNNNTGTKPVKYKSTVKEMLALDVKPVEDFMYPNNDIVRKENGDPAYLERPILFDRMGQTQTAIALSEYLPAGTEFEVHLRVRTDSPLNANDAKIIRELLDLGKNQGLGQWRGSGGKGSYFYKLVKVKKDPTKIPDGWS